MEPTNLHSPSSFLKYHSLEDRKWRKEEWIEEWHLSISYALPIPSLSCPYPTTERTLGKVMCLSPPAD